MERPELQDKAAQIEYAEGRFLDLAEELDREGVESYYVYLAMQRGSHELFDLGWGING